MDRRQAMARGESLPERTQGAALFADISGFTPLTEALTRTLGPQRGAEELTRQLNLVYDTLIAEVDRYGGSTISFSGDAITCWFERDHGLRATQTALSMQQAMQAFNAIILPNGDTVSLALKVAVASGVVRRFVVGDPAVQLIDVLAGQTLQRLALAEHHANKGEVVLDASVVANVREQVGVREWRMSHEQDEPYAIVNALLIPISPHPWGLLTANALQPTQLRPWILPSIYERIRAGQTSFLAELRPAVALFLSFEGIDYDHDEEARDKLDAFLCWSQQIIARYEGSLLQLTIGDKGSYFYVAFGAPIAHDDDTERAIAAALELRAAPSQLSFISAVHIGISRGRMRVGPYGGMTSRTYGVLGDDVNFAARLMQTAEAGQILVSQRINESARGKFRFVALPPLKVKGKAEAAYVFALEGAQVAPVVHLQEPSYALPMVGRSAELAVLVEKLELTAQSYGQVVSIVAEAGMGKSRLIAEMLHRAHALGFVGFGGECQSHGTTTPYLVWRNIWRGFFDIDAHASPAEQIQQAERALAQLDPAFLPRLPLLGLALNLPIPDNELTHVLDAQLRKASLEALLVDCVKARIASRGRGTMGRAASGSEQGSAPLLFVLEDSHWMDALSADLLSALARIAPNYALMIVLAYRPTDVRHVSTIPPLANKSVLTLQAFNALEVMRLVELKLGQLGGGETTHSPVLVKRISERTQGNPFYIEELLNYWRDRGIDPSDTAALEQVELPDSLQSLILSRIDQLSESQKIMLKVASIIGRVFQLRWLWGIYPELGNEAQVRSDFETLNQMELTALDTPEPEVRYLFKHMMTQEVAYNSQPYASRSEFHERLGRYLEGMYSEVLEKYIDLLAYHYGHSENVDKQREYYRRAGEAAQAAFANAAAIEYFQKLLPLITAHEQVEVLFTLGTICEHIGDWSACEWSYQQAMQVGEQLGEAQQLANCQRGLGRLFSLRGDYALALSWLERARETYLAINDQHGLRRTIIRIGWVYDRLGNSAQARTVLQEGLAMSRAANDLQSVAESLNDLGINAYRKGEREEAMTLWEESLPIRRQIGDKPGMAQSLGNLGIVARIQGDYTKARALMEEALAIQREIGDKLNMAKALSGLGSIAKAQGDLRTAKAYTEESVTLLRELGAKSVMATVLNNLGHLMLEQGDSAKAYSLYAESLALNRESNDKHGIAGSLAGLIGASAAQRQAPKAARLAGAIEALLAAIDAKLDPPDMAVYQQGITTLHALLNEADLSAALAAGKAMTLEQVMEYALQDFSATEARQRD
jgi:class 3 adenylate cyclase/tetratricopeptide (TPR) repeat protein